MPSRLVHWRTLTFGVSCLLHLGLIAVVLLAEQALSAHASRPLPCCPSSWSRPPTRRNRSRRLA